ncbi:MAG TPA: M1 family metallopeptidase [Actinomycetota bacterium]
MRSQRLLSVLLVTASTLVFAPAAGTAPAPPATCGPDASAGTLGVGDPYYPRFGNGGYDVQHYDLAIRYGPRTNHLRGVATITALTTQSLSCFSLDLVGLTVHAITVNGDPATWSRTHHELMITPALPLGSGADLTVVVTYDGFPKGFVIPSIDAVSGFIRTADGVIVAGEPESATAWFPVNDHPTDRASYTFRITVPNGYDVVANGVPESTQRQGNWTTHVWQAPDPMASYLATFDVGEWTMRFRETASGVPVIDAIDPDVLPRVRASLRREPEIVSFLESRFGPYPFESVGGIFPDTGRLGFALETQTRPVYARVFFPNGESVIVHELAHQWFGDLVAVDRWQHIWLNEGFATYAEWLWSGHEGFGTPRRTFEAIWGAIPSDSPFWQVVIGDPGVDDLFDGAVYVRGAMTLQALRNRVGDDAFWTTLHLWTEQHAFGTGTTDAFVALAEQVSGQDLSDLFDVWLFTPGRPPASAVTGSGVVRVSTTATDHATAWLREFARRTAP